MPLFEEHFLPCSFANRKGYGTHKAFYLARRYYRKYAYILKCDIKRYFPSIDHEILKQKIREVIHDEDTLRLIDSIIDSESGCESYYNGAGDLPLFDCYRKRGIPIGNLTSQYFSNIYLNSLDHFVFNTLGYKAYIRYVDDFVLFKDNKQELKIFKEKIKKYLYDLRLVLKCSRQWS